MTALIDEATAPSVFVAHLSAWRERLAAFEPERYEPAACVELAEALSALAKSCEVAAVRAAARASACGAHRAHGHADGHDWVAAISGTTSSAARDALQTVARLDECPETRDALVTGEVSIAEASEIVRTEREVPGSEHDLLEIAKTRGLGAVRDRSRERRLESGDPEQLRRRQHAARAVRHWHDRMGMVCGSFRLTPVAGTSFVNRLDREADRRWRAAKRGGHEITREQAAADAFAALMSVGPEASATTSVDLEGRGRRSVNADVVIVQSAEAARRGHVHPGEVCHVLGGGPVAPSEVEELIAAGAFVKAALHDGKQVTHVADWGRHLTAHQRTALGIGPPPGFDGLRCSEPECERRLGLEIDHVDPVANGGPTSLENLDPKCWVHHDAKTRRDRAAGLLEHGP